MRRFDKVTAVYVPEIPLVRPGVVMLYAVATDGSLWHKVETANVCIKGQQWTRVEDLPQDGAA